MLELLLALVLVGLIGVGAVMIALRRFSTQRFKKELRQKKLLMTLGFEEKEREQVLYQKYPEKIVIAAVCYRSFKEWKTPNLMKMFWTGDQDLLMRLPQEELEQYFRDKKKEIENFLNSISEVTAKYSQEQPFSKKEEVKSILIKIDEEEDKFLSLPLPAHGRVELIPKKLNASTGVAAEDGGDSR